MLKKLIKRLDSISARHNDLMTCMSELNKDLDSDSSDCYVGPFWYSPVDKKCYGCRKVSLGEASSFTSNNGITYKTSRYLHKDIWKLLGKKYPNEKRYTGNYMNFPRGRVFWYEDEGIVVNVGSWFSNLQDIDSAKQAIIEEFELPENVQFIEDEHWDIGRGDSIDFLK